MSSSSNSHLLLSGLTQNNQPPPFSVLGTKSALLSLFSGLCPLCPHALFWVPSRSKSLLNYDTLKHSSPALHSLTKCSLQCMVALAPLLAQSLFTSWQYIQPLSRLRRLWDDDQNFSSVWPKKRLCLSLTPQILLPIIGHIKQLFLLSLGTWVP